MRLRTKLTALCAALLLLVAVTLTAAMLWQVREIWSASSTRYILHVFSRMSRALPRIRKCFPWT